jgi:hypothetical protein
VEPSISLFEGIVVHVVNELLGQLDRRSFPPGDVIIAEGDPPGAVYVIESGTAEVSVASDGVELPIGPRPRDADNPNSSQSRPDRSISRELPRRSQATMSRVRKTTRETAAAMTP